MIDRVEFENFKSLFDVSVELERLTVLAGPNGSGKTSVLQGTELLGRAATPLPEEGMNTMSRFRWLLQGPWEPTRLNRAKHRPLKLRIREQSGDELELVLGVPPEEGVSEDPVVRVNLAGPAGALSISLPTLPPSTPQPMLTDPRLLHFGSVAYLSLDAGQMAAPSYSDAESPRMQRDGSQLASALAWMKGAEEEQLALLTQRLARIVPGVRRIRTLREAQTVRKMNRLDVDGQPMWRPVGVTEIADRFEIQFDDGNSIPSDLLSEGTVLALGLLVKLHEPERPRLLLLDDIDRGLHIEAQARLVEVLRELLAQDPELQLVCTSHSPYLLDRFEPSEVRMLALDEQRCTRVLALDQHPDFERWQYGTQTGELWAALGNAWARPSPSTSQ